MHCEEYDINLAEDVHLLHDIRLDGKLYPKGHPISKEDIIIFKMAGIRRISGMKMAEGDLSWQTALGIIAAKICGDNLGYLLDEDGLCRIVAAEPGIFVNLEDRTAKFNRLNPSLILNTVEPYSLLQKHETAAVLEITVPVISQSDVDEIIFKLSGNSALLSVDEIKPRASALVYAKLLDDPDENNRFTASVKKLVKDFSAFGLTFNGEFTAPYQIEAAADALENALKSPAEVVFMLGAMPAACERDALPQAVLKIADAVVSCRIPQIGASDLLIAAKRAKKIIILPSDYGHQPSQLIDRYIKQAIFSTQLLADAFAHHQPCLLEGGEVLSPDQTASLMVPRFKAGERGKTNIAAVILAAGIGSRSGRNKLLVETKDEQPLFMHAVNAAIRSKASPVFVITGYHHEEMEEYLDKVDVNVIYNPGYRSGIKTSISLGLNSVPAFCEGTVLIPADMPNITAAEIDKLIATFKPKQEKQVCLFSCSHVKANPVLWSRELYDRADIVPENAAERIIFMEHSDYTHEVKIKDCNKLLDVNYPSDVEKVSKK